MDFVPVTTFDANGRPEDVRLRDRPTTSARGRRAVVCEPRGLFGLFRRRKPIPSRFLETATARSS